MESGADVPSFLAGLPPEWPDDRLSRRVRAGIVASRRKLVVLDDDPTGVQTVHGLAVLAGWSVPDLTAELEEAAPAFFVLTNSRSVPPPEAAALNRAIADNLVAASARSGVAFALASRSDSTLRGHFPIETDALGAALGGVDGVLLVPAFIEGERYTVGDVHWVRDGDRFLPAAETEFARDTTFGYRAPDLRAWVEEKTAGRIPASAVASLGVVEIRRGGPEAVTRRLAELRDGRPMVVNVASYQDLEVVVAGLLRSEAAGKRFLYRTAASFVRARAGLLARPLLSRAELLGSQAPPRLPGLVVVGSHVRRTSEQLGRLLLCPEVIGIQLSVREVLDGRAARDREVERVGGAARAALRAGRTPVVYTSRDVAVIEGAPGGPASRDPLAVSRAVSSALVAVVRRLDERPGWVVGKGGITSSDIGTAGLGARRAIVLGQVRPGVPVWRLGPEARHPGLPYVVFPGNVGGPETLAEVVDLLRG